MCFSDVVAEPWRSTGRVTGCNRRWNSWGKAWIKGNKLKEIWPFWGLTYYGPIATYQDICPTIKRSLFLCLPKSNKSKQTPDIPATKVPNCCRTIKSVSKPIICCQCHYYLVSITLYCNKRLYFPVTPLLQQTGFKFLKYKPKSMIIIIDFKLSPCWICNMFSFV